MASQSIMAKFLSDDTLGSGEPVVGSGLTLAEKSPSGVEPDSGHTLTTDKIPLGSNQSGTYTHSANDRDIHTQRK